MSRLFALYQPDTLGGGCWELRIVAVDKGEVVQSLALQASSAETAIALLPRRLLNRPPYKMLRLPIGLLPGAVAAWEPLNQWEAA